MRSRERESGEEREVGGRVGGGSNKVRQKKGTEY